MDYKFRPVLRKHDRVSRGAIHKNKNSFSPDDFLIKLEQHLTQNVSDFPKFCRVSLLAVNNKYNIKMTAILLQDNIDDDRILYNLIIIKVFKPKISKAERKTTNVWKISTLNKGC